jgi:hypothetical protein
MAAGRQLAGSTGNIGELSKKESVLSSKRQKPPANERMVVKLMAKKSGRKVAKTTPLRGTEGVNMADKLDGENVFESFTKLNESFFKPDGAKKAAAWYIETSEKLATQIIELQEKATSWAKETPLAPLFEAQSSIARKLVERSAAAARNLWQLSAE